MSFSIPNAPLILVNVILFPLWMIAVGGMILLHRPLAGTLPFCPRLGFADVPSLGIRRFAHWAKFAVPHIMSFFASIHLLVRFVLGFEMGLAFFSSLAGRLAWRGEILTLVRLFPLERMTCSRSS